MKQWRIFKGWEDFCISILSVLTTQCNHQLSPMLPQSDNEYSSAYHFLPLRSLPLVEGLNPLFPAAWIACTCIAAECCVHLATVYRIAHNLLQYSGICAPAVRKFGRPQRLTTADERQVKLFE